MSLNNLIFNQSILNYKETYLASDNGYPKLLSVTLLCHLSITNENSSLVNPHTGAILGEALKSCITAETMQKLKKVDPVNKAPLQVVLIGCELYINPLFRFKCKENYLAKDVIFLGRINKESREAIKTITELLGKKITNKPHYCSVAVTEKTLSGKKVSECIKYKNTFYTAKNYISIWEVTALGMYL